jgi:hypothetical protein
MSPAVLARVAIVGAVAWIDCSRTTQPPASGAAPPVADCSGLDAGPVAAAPAPPSPLCGDPGQILLFTSPEHPTRGRALTVVAVTDRAVDGRLVVEGPGSARSSTAERQGGTPYFWLARVDAAAVGLWRATMARADVCGAEILARKEATVRPWRVPMPSPPSGALWAIRAQWSASIENLYSAWVEHLFDAPLEAQLSFSALHEVLRDPSRNFLFGHLGAAEDAQGIVVKPDCADLPYFLRAYFSFKLGLPFGWSHCSRGEGGEAPTCSDFASNVAPFVAVNGKAPLVPGWADPDRERDPRDTNVKRFGEFLRTTLADAAQSGAGRTAAHDETGDYYPVALSVETLRPGTIFADPYGHVLVVAKRVPQTPDRGGILLAVDGQPDGTVARKRFWRGNFLFAIDPSLGSAGFKRFRPVLGDNAGKLHRPRNAELADYSFDQYAGGVEGFYDRVEDVLSPDPLDPMQALLETLQALEEQVKTRVVSVENGRKFLLGGKPPAEMPEGARIFETTGEWEDFSTPSRDLRLLIAVDVACALPAHVARRADRYAMPTGKTAEEVQRQLEDRLSHELRQRTFRYTRSDGSDWELRLGDVVDRQNALEVAYDPNDCVEKRWGAPPGSSEASTCLAHAPDRQVEKMQEYRAWFHERRRPPR